ncbi:MAG: SWIM zinc finger family protein [Verrucomicrobiota bacterium]
MLTSDQITAIAPDAPSLKAGRDLATPRKWQSTGGDDEVLWGLAMGSGKEPYQTRVSLTDLARKCSCPSRKFPCKHALGLMFMAAASPAAMSDSERPPWVTEWLESRVTREQKAVARAEEKVTRPVDVKAAEKRRAQREDRVNEGVALLQQTLLDLTREGLASGSARDAGAWENLAKRMVDAQAPGLAGNLRHIADTVLRDPEVDVQLPFELGRLHVLLQAITSADDHDEPTHAELVSQLGGRLSSDATDTSEIIEDEWFVAGRKVEERDRLITSSTWLLGKKLQRWARILRFAPVPQTIAEPWPLGSTVRAALKFQTGLYPFRAAGDGSSEWLLVPTPCENDLGKLLERFSSALAANPFLRVLPFFIPLRPGDGSKWLVDATGAALPWRATDDLALRVECICGGTVTPMCGEWDGRHLRLLAIRDGDAWIHLTYQQP